jgi:hypothetical protein
MRQRSVLILGAVIVLIYTLFARGESQVEDNTTAPVSVKVPTKFDAYGICAQLAQDKYGKADHSLIEGIDMGDGDWIIRGSSQIDGSTIYWTGEVVHNADETWKLKGWTDR